MPDQLQRDPLRTQLQGLLLDQILEGKLEPGQQLNLATLSEQWDVSRTPLREALLALEREGLVGYTRGKGFYVWPLSARESVNLYQIAGALERLAIRTTEEVPDSMIESLERLNERLRQVQGEPEEMIQWDGRFHHELVRRTTNDDLLEMIQNVRNRLYRYRFYGYEYVTVHELDEKRRSVGEHGEIMASLEDGDLESAASLLESHWERGTELMERWLADPTEGPRYSSNLG